MNNYTLTSKATAGNPADVNGDGGVDGADLGILFNNWGPATANTPGNFDGSGEVDGADIAFVYNNWTGDARSTASVPEPASFASSGAGIICALVARFRRRKAVPTSA
ncbi:MAG: PEP-CTERM sorting domain-containing protein [Planctomycetota bacterium]|nr:PEP-CTERM sorting domain-containing protein [Planctomycetota bacterium]MDA1179080.1 PEP-CTERM sorting domain-containing protein [Planctomycetota bacterium]